MKLLVLLAAALVAAAPAARADEKSDAILKGLRLRAANSTTYSVTIEITQKGKTDTATVWIQPPGKFRAELADRDGLLVFVTDGREAATIANGKARQVSSKDWETDNRFFRKLAFGLPEILVGEITRTEYVTQKMLNDLTRVDVLDVWGKTAGAQARLYIDNDGQIRKIVGHTKDALGTIVFTNPRLDEPIPNAKFAVPKDS